MPRRSTLFLGLLLTCIAPAAACQTAERIENGRRVIRDLEYGRVGDRPLLSDLYRPARATDEPLPLVVWVHGGGWEGGDKQHNTMAFLTQHGFAVASIGYRLSGEAIYPAQIEDVRAAIRFLRTHAEKYQLRTDRIGAAGGSAGGHLVSLLGTTDVDQPGQPSSRVQAVANLCGPTDLLKLAAQTDFHSELNRVLSQLFGGPVEQKRDLALAASPVTHASSDDPPFLFIHGTEDTLVNIEQPHLLRDRLLAAGVDAKLLLLQGQGHNLQGPVLQQAVATFFREKLGTQYGYARTVFDVGTGRGFILLPRTKRADGTRPWVWYAPTLIDQYPNANCQWILAQLLDAGFAVCGMDVGESMGNPEGRELFSQFHQIVTKRYGLDAKADLIAQSRGGLMLYNWAAEKPSLVRSITGIYPVCNLKSWPGLDRVAPHYGMTADELAGVLEQHNPIDRLQPLAAADIPILHIHGDADQVVPLDANSQMVFDRYQGLGGRMQLLVVQGKGHAEIPEFFRDRRVVDFILHGGRE